ncbi:MAG TPA: hypothetical protein PK390_02995 [Fervidobacterium nodosum]|nr:hypothetical protein [Fervidobacterium nodosum]
MSRLNVINKYIQRLFRSQDDDYTSIITPFFPVNTPEGRESPFYSLLN